MANTERPSAEDALTLTVHAMPRAELQEPDTLVEAPRRRRGRLAMMLILLACAAPVIASYFTYFVVRPQARTNYATLLQPTLEWPTALPLRTQAGAPMSPQALRGPWLLVVMGDASCDAACEQRLFMQRQLREMVGRERERVDKLFLVLDDQPLRPALSEALSAKPATRVLRASRESVAQWLKADAATFDQHLYIVDPMGQWMMRAPAQPEPSKLKRDLERLLRASGSWHRAGG